MPFWSDVKKAASEIANEVRDDVAGLSRGVYSNVQYNLLMKSLSQPVGKTLTEQKFFALTQCRTQIPNFTNRDAVEFFKQLNTSTKLQYIRQETGAFYKLFGEYGHTTTYKKITELLKSRVMENYKRHSTAQNRDRGDDIAEEHQIMELMTCQRGRLPNVLASIGESFGQTGEFNAEYKKRRLP